MQNVDSRWFYHGQTMRIKRNADWSESIRIANVHRGARGDSGTVGLTNYLGVFSGQKLVEDVVITLVVLLEHYSRFLEQI